MKIKTLFFSICLFASCGKLEDETPADSVAPTPTPTPIPSPDAGQTNVATPTPTPTPTPTAAPLQAKVFVGSSTQRFITGYTSAGTLVKTYDLSPYFISGGVSSMKFADASNLLVFFDVGAAGERIIKINVDTDDINPAWGIDAANLNNVTLNAMTFSGGALYLQKSTNIERYTYNIPNSLFTRISTGGWPVTATASCLITAINSIVPVTNAGVDYVLQLSSGANNRINTWSNFYTGTPACPAAGNSYNYTTSFPTAATYAANSGIQMPDGKVYIRYTNSGGAPLLAKYDFNGTSIANGTTVLADLGAFGASTTIRQQAVALDSTTMLFANWDNDFIGTVTTAGAWDIFIRDGYTVDVGAIAVKP